MILETESIGTEKLSPSAPSTFIVLTPTTSPSMFTRGPPEFPFTNTSERENNCHHHNHTIDQVNDQLISAKRAYG